MTDSRPASRLCCSQWPHSGIARWVVPHAEWVLELLMGTYTFVGTVLRAHSPITIVSVREGALDPIRVSVMDTEGRLAFDAAVRVVASHVEVVVRDTQGSDAGTLGNYADRLVRGLLDAHGFINGEAYDLSITHYIDHSFSGPNWVQPFTVGALSLESGVETTFDDLARIVFQNARDDLGSKVVIASAHLAQALADIREAIRNPHDTALFCFRAITLRDSGVLDQKAATAREPSPLRLVVLAVS